MSLKPIQEIAAVCCLLLATLSAIFINQLVPRTLTFDQSTISDFTCLDDSVNGGRSSCSAEFDNEFLKLKYDVQRKRHVVPFAKMRIYPGQHEDPYQDLSWVESYEIEVRCDKPGDNYFGLMLRNFETGTSEDDDRASRKINVALFKATDELSVAKIKRNEFIVPTWWQRRYKSTGDEGRPAFNNTEWIEISTKGDCGEGELEVKSIRCIGHWVNAAMLNQILLWMWMGGTLIVSMCRMLGLKKELDEKTARAISLQQRNNLLASESESYQELARRDPLTGLLNRYGLESKFEELTAANVGYSYTMVLFDLDKFKRINDTQGHCYGDRVLLDVAQIVSSKLRNTDLIARWGGDEFLIILTDQGLHEADELTESIRQSVRASDLNYSCSFGVCESVEGVSLTEILCNADSAMYDSKNDGRDTTSIFRTRKGDTKVDSPAPDEDAAVVFLTAVEPPPISGISIHQ